MVSKDASLRAIGLIIVLMVYDGLSLLWVVIGARSLRFHDDLSFEQSREIRALTDYNIFTGQS